MILIIAVVCWIMMERIYAETECKSFLLFMILCIFFYFSLYVNKYLCRSFNDKCKYLSRQKNEQKLDFG